MGYTGKVSFAIFHAIQKTVKQPPQGLEKFGWSYKREPEAGLGWRLLTYLGGGGSAHPIKKDCIQFVCEAITGSVHKQITWFSFVYRSVCGLITTHKMNNIFPAYAHPHSSLGSTKVHLHMERFPPTEHDYLTFLLQTAALNLSPLHTFQRVLYTDAWALFVMISPYIDFGCSFIPSQFLWVRVEHI